MRISDWSSDVCSSDLDGTVNVRLDNSNGPLLVDQMGPKLLGAAEANGKIQLTLDPFGNSGLVSVPASGALAGLADAYVPLSDSASALDTLANQRSEEHTSELQSLMRISYAVFRLTKKT